MLLAEAVKYNRRTDIDTLFVQSVLTAVHALQNVVILGDFAQTYRTILFLRNQIFHRLTARNNQLQR